MTIFDEMVAELGPQTSIDMTNAQHEVMQQIALSGLRRSTLAGYLVKGLLPATGRYDCV